MNNYNTPHQLPLFPERTCTGCNRTLPHTLEYFYMKGGKLDSRCIRCRKEYRKKYLEDHPFYNKDYYWANRDSELERSHDWYQENRDYAIEYSRQWNEENPDYHHEYYLKNKERITAQNNLYRSNNRNRLREVARRRRERNKGQYLEYSRQWRKDNPDKIHRYNRQWRKKNAQRNLERLQQWRKDNPDYSRQWYEENKDKARMYEYNRRALESQADGHFTSDDITTMEQQQNHRCYYCGKKRKLTIDHKTPLSRGGSNYPYNLCLACKSCNSQKGAKTEQEYLNWLADLDT